MAATAASTTTARQVRTVQTALGADRASRDGRVMHDMRQAAAIEPTRHVNHYVYAMVQLVFGPCCQLAARRPVDYCQCAQPHSAWSKDDRAADVRLKVFRGLKGVRRIHIPGTLRQPSVLVCDISLSLRAHIGKIPIYRYLMYCQLVGSPAPLGLEIRLLASWLRHCLLSTSL